MDKGVKGMARLSTPFSFSLSLSLSPFFSLFFIEFKARTNRSRYSRVMSIRFYIPVAMLLHFKEPRAHARTPLHCVRITKCMLNSGANELRALPTTRSRGGNLPDMKSENAATTPVLPVIYFMQNTRRATLFHQICINRKRIFYPERFAPVRFCYIAFGHGSFSTIANS